MVDLELSDEWWERDDPEMPATESNFAATLHEIEIELGPRHELSGKLVRVEARFRPSDDVIVRLIDDTFALVHPTWSGKVEPLPHPTTTRLGDADTASAAIAEWERRY